RHVKHGDSRRVGGDSEWPQQLHVHLDRGRGARPNTRVDEQRIQLATGRAGKTDAVLCAAQACYDAAFCQALEIDGDIPPLSAAGDLPDEIARAGQAAVQVRPAGQHDELVDLRMADQQIADTRVGDPTDV